MDNLKENMHENDISDEDDSDDDLAEHVSLNSEPETESDDSDGEDDIPLQQRWDAVMEYLTWNEDNDECAMTEHPFTDQKAGIQEKCGIKSDSTVIEIFEFFYDHDVIDMICYQSNIYRESLKDKLEASNKLKKRSRILEIDPFLPSDICIYFALNILMGIIKKPNLEMYWTTDPVFETPVFSQNMSLKRFQSISRYIHFSNDDSNDKLRKISPLFDSIVEKFQLLYRPGKNVSIDESLIKYKGRLSIRQCNLSKRARFGIKLYKICDSETGYIYYVIIYKGKDPDGSKFLCLWESCKGYVG